MSKHPKGISLIFKKACEIKNARERDIFIANECEKNEDCIDKVNQLIIYDAIANNLEEIEKLKEIERETQSLLGQKIGNYFINKKLGSGGMAVVYRGAKYDEQEYENRAIKVIKQNRFTEKVFFRETENLKKVSQHPNIARLIESGIDERTNYPYFVLQYINGLSITEYCDSKKISLSKRLRLFVKVCEAVNYLHTDLKIVHCDIKPSNILIQFHPEKPFLIDFGIAKIIKKISDEMNPDITEIIGFTPVYTSPEMISNEKVTEATDIYSLGLVLYELLTSQKAHLLFSPGDKTKEEIYEEQKRVICEQIPILPSEKIHYGNIKITSQNRKCTPKQLERFLKGDVDRIVMKALKKNAEDRYESVEDLIYEINLCINKKKNNGSFSDFRRNWQLSLPRMIFYPVLLSVLLFIFWYIFSLSQEVKKFTRNRFSDEQAKIENVFSSPPPDPVNKPASNVGNANAGVNVNTNPTNSLNNRPTIIREMSDVNKRRLEEKERALQNPTPFFRQLPVTVVIEVLADNTANGWTNARINKITRGQRIRIKAKGSVSLGNGNFSPPEGIDSLKDDNKLIANKPTGGLIAVIGDDNNDFIFIGKANEFIASHDGALFLGINEGNLDDNEGAFEVTIEIDPVSD